MRALIPSHREKKRYLLIKGENLKENIEKAILEFIGINGMSKTGLSFIETKKNQAIICVNRESVNLIRASLCVFKDKMETIKVSGTLKSLRKTL
jgi:RNase P/RNase MRP subunit POP5